MSQYRCRMCDVPVLYVPKWGTWVHDDEYRGELCMKTGGNSVVEPECAACERPLYGQLGEICRCTEVEDD